MLGADIELRGPMAELRDLPLTSVKGERVSEVLIYSSAGTGKTFGNACVLVEWCLEYPGSRWLVVRKTLKSLRESWQTTFEDLVAPRYGIPTPTSNKSSRESYKIGDSMIVLGGLEDAERHRSTEWNGVLFVEGTEAEKSDFEEFTRSLRWQEGAPFHLKIIECNPKSQFHWIYKRFFGMMDPEEVASYGRFEIEPGRVAMRATIKDNPAFWDFDSPFDVEGHLSPEGKAYVEKMKGGYSGAAYKQMVEGLWCADDGLVYPEFGIHTHTFDGGLLKKNGTWYVDTERHGTYRVIGFFGDQDWGMDKPGVAHVWAVDEFFRVWMVREWYHTRWNPNRWAGVWDQQRSQVGLKRIVCDGADAGAISILNDYMTSRGGRQGRRLAIGATGALKDKIAGRGLVSAKLEERINGLPGVCFLRDALQHRPDPEVVDSGAPWCTVQEFGGYVMDVDKSGMSKDEPVKKNDHGMDALRYGLRWFFKHGIQDEGWAISGWADPPWMDMDDPDSAALVKAARRRWAYEKRK